jgi:hypothetical protein
MLLKFHTFQLEEWHLELEPWTLAACNRPTIFHTNMGHL